MKPGKNNLKTSYDNCPLCQSKLEMHVLDLDNNQVIISYSCPTEVIFFNEAKGKAKNASHCFIRTFSEGDIIVAVIFPYLLTFCFQDVPVTRITKIFLDKPRKYLTAIPLLDMDLSKPQDIIERLDRLILFI